MAVVELVIEYASVLLYRVNLLGCILGTDHWHKRKGKFSLPFLAYEVNTLSFSGLFKDIPPSSQFEENK